MRAESFKMSWPRQTPLPESGRRSPHNMRMKVVFPEPLGPKKPKISPLATFMLRFLTTVLGPNDLVRFCTSMTRSVSFTGAFLAGFGHINRLSRVQAEGHGRFHGGLNHEHQFCPGLTGIDHRRRVLRPGGYKGDTSRNRASPVKRNGYFLFPGKGGLRSFQVRKTEF